MWFNLKLLFKKPNLPITKRDTINKTSQPYERVITKKYHQTLYYSY